MPATAQERGRGPQLPYTDPAARAPDPVLLLDREGTVLHASPAVGPRLGCRPEQVRGLSAVALAHPRDRSRVRKALAAVLPPHRAEFGSPELFTYRIRHGDGAWHYVQAHATGLFDGSAGAALVLTITSVAEKGGDGRRREAGELHPPAMGADSWAAISLHDAEGAYRFCSSAFARFGYDPKTLVGASPFELVHPDDRDAVAESFRQLADGEQRATVADYRFWCRDGTWRRLESSAERLDDLSIGAAVVTTRDVTAVRRRARQQQAVAELSKEVVKGGTLEDVLERIPTTVADALGAGHCRLLRFDPDGTRVVASSSDPADGRRYVWAGLPVTTGTREGPAPAPPVLDRLRAAGVPSGTAKGWDHALEIAITPTTGPPGALAISAPATGDLGADDAVFLQTVTGMLAAALSRRNAEEVLRQQALYDDLTGLPNRTLIRDRLEVALSRLEEGGRNVTLLLVDLDDFMLINDSLGHTTGDSVVIAIANRLKGVVPAPDTVARFGGDEFVIISEEPDPAGSRRLAEEVRDAVAAPLSVNGTSIAVTASIGCATTADPRTPSESLLGEADMALYEAKRAGKNRVEMFAPVLRRRTAAQLEIVSSIRRGLDAGEFRLFYQPVYNLTTGHVTGHEALVRWHHPTSGLLLPDRFIPYAEGSGLIIPLGKWVLATGCRQSVEWRRAGRPGRVLINVSERQLVDTGFVRDVADALWETGARPEDVHLEVTESVLSSDIERARAALDALHDLGVHLGLDDFGTGWSSLSQLAFLPFDFVKIDRSFVQHDQSDPRMSVLVRSMVDLGTALGLRVIVEGVETAEQLEYVRRLNAHMAQGFFLGRPAPPGDPEPSLRHVG